MTVISYLSSLQDCAVYETENKILHVVSISLLFLCCNMRLIMSSNVSPVSSALISSFTGRIVRMLILSLPAISVLDKMPD